MPLLAELAAFLDELLEVARTPDDAGGIVRASERPITRLGMVLEPWPEIGRWAHDNAIDALFIHRPWRLDGTLLAPDVGIIAYHRAFDEHLTISYNPWLAQRLSLTAVEVLGTKEGRPIGMIGEASADVLARWSDQLADVFGGLDEAHPARRAGTRIAVVGAMNDALVREAASRGAIVYVTGQWRLSAAAAVAATGIGVAVVGHRRSEEWGLDMLADLLRERWTDIEVVRQTNDH